MATTSVTIRMDENLKKQAEVLFEEMGLNMTTAMTIFTKAVVWQGKIPFEIAADPFWSEANQAHLRKAIADLEAGKGKPHELVGAMIHKRYLVFLYGSWISCYMKPLVMNLISDFSNWGTCPFPSSCQNLLSYDKVGHNDSFSRCIIGGEDDANQRRKTYLIGIPDGFNPGVLFRGLQLQHPTGHKHNLYSK